MCELEQGAPPSAHSPAVFWDIVLLTLQTYSACGVHGASPRVLKCTNG